MAAKYFLPLRFGVMRGSKSVGEKIKIIFAGSNFDWENCDRRHK